MAFAKFHVPISYTKIRAYLKSIVIRGHQALDGSTNSYLLRQTEFLLVHVKEDQKMLDNSSQYRKRWRGFCDQAYLVFASSIAEVLYVYMYVICMYVSLTLCVCMYVCMYIYIYIYMLVMARNRRYIEVSAVDPLWTRMCMLRMRSGLFQHSLLWASTQISHLPS